MTLKPGVSTRKSSPHVAQKERVKSWLLCRCCFSLLNCDVAASAQPSPARSFKKQTHRRLKTSFAPSTQPGPARLLLFRSQRPAWSGLSFAPSTRPARLARSKKRAHQRLKAWMHACAPSVLHETRLCSCRHEAKWAAAGTLSGSPATITSPGAHDAFSKIVFDNIRFFSLFLVGPQSGPLSGPQSGPGSGARRGGGVQR